jgi:hypothetical protein
MKSVVLSTLLLLALSGCKKESDDIDTQPEYKDWYAFKSPDTRAIQAAIGDIDGTLVITTGFKIYQTKDRGKTWKTATYTANHGLFGFLSRQDTLLALNLQVGAVVSNTTTAYAASPSFFSVDEGLTWLPYRHWDRKVDFEPRIARNRVTTPIGTEYSFEILLTPTSPNSGTSYVETVGILSSTGQALQLPQDHQMMSLHLDSKSRLYVSASGPLCGRRQDFAFCGDENGILYVSKAPLR